MSKMQNPENHTLFSGFEFEFEFEFEFIVLWKQIILQVSWHRK